MLTMLQVTKTRGSDFQNLRYKKKDTKAFIVKKTDNSNGEMIKKYFHKWRMQKRKDLLPLIMLHQVCSWIKVYS